MAMIEGAVTGLKTAGDIIMGLAKLRTITEVQANAIDLQQIILGVQSSLLSAQSEQMGFLKQIRELKTEVEGLKAWDLQRQRYKLTNPWDGAVTYTLRQSMANGEPAHWICTSCYEVGRKSILNPVKGRDSWYLLVCPVCNSNIQSPWRNAAHPQYATD